LTAVGSKVLNYAILRFCTISMHIMLGTLCQIFEVGDDWNIFKCTLH
jgi:hypothetical protein